MGKKVNVLLVIPILIAFFSVGFISAASCDIKLRTICDSEGNYTVMGVSGLTDAHGELASEGNYDSVLCCDFGEGNTTCNNNKIIGLSSATNAHAEIPTETTYTTEVCYEDLECTVIDGACPIIPYVEYYPVEMMSLSADTNAHIGGFDYYSTYNICCASDNYAAPPCSLTNAYWSLSDTSPTPITGDETVFTGQDVYLIVEGTNCAGEEISFEVWEYDLLFSDTLMDSNPPVDVIFGSNAMWTAEWMDDGPLQGDPEYYFIATVAGSSPIESLGAFRLEVSSESTDDYCLDEGIFSCEDYIEEGNCMSDSGLCDVADNGGEFCDEYSCSCSWDDVDGCQTAYYSEGADGEIGGRCTITQEVISECEAPPEGFFTYSWTGDWTGDPEGDAWEECTAGGTKSQECPAQIQLPFFNFYNVIITLALIALVYFFLIKEKQRKTSKNKTSKKRKKK